MCHAPFVSTYNRAGFGKCVNSAPCAVFLTYAISFCGAFGVKTVLPVRDTLAAARFYVVVFYKFLHFCPSRFLVINIFLFLVSLSAFDKLFNRTPSSD